MRKLPQNLFLVLCGVLSALSALEVGVRVFNPQPVWITRAPGVFFVRYDGLLGWCNKEGARGRFAPDPSLPATSVSINASGFRGGDPAVRKKGVQRVLFLGDSNTFGYCVEEGERFSDLVAGASGGRLEQVNLGVFGYGTDQEAMLLESTAGSYRPDTVVLGISAGDLSDCMCSINGGAAKPFFRIAGDRLLLRNVPVPQQAPFLKSGSLASGLKNLAYRNSHLYRLVLGRLLSGNLYMPDSVLEMRQQEGFQVMQTLIRGMRDHCRENGVRFVALLIPHGAWLGAIREAAPDTRSMPGYFNQLKGELVKNGIEVVDPAPALLGALAKGEPVFFDKDPVHLTARGNAVVARVLQAALSAQTPERRGADRR